MVAAKLVLKFGGESVVFKKNTIGSWVAVGSTPGAAWCLKMTDPSHIKKRLERLGLKYRWETPIKIVYVACSECKHHPCGRADDGTAGMKIMICKRYEA